MDNINPQGLVIPDQQQDLDMQPPQPRARRTHKDDFISSLLSKLSLREKLSKNKEIEDQNKIREQKTYDHHMDPVSHLETGSEIASFISIDEADVKDLKDPSIHARFLNIIPDFLLLRITRELRADREEREKRKLQELVPQLSESSLDAKRRRMDGSKAAECVIGTSATLSFHISFLPRTHPFTFFSQRKSVLYY